MKKRIILDGKASLVSKVVSKREGVILPRVLDAICNMFNLMVARRLGTTEFAVVDFSDAFWRMPLNIRERKCFVSRLRSIWFVYRRMAQGSRTAPLMLGQNFCTSQSAQSGYVS